MKQLLVLLFIPFLSTQECCKHKEKTTGASGYSRPDTDTLPTLPSCVRKMIDESYKLSPPEVPLEINEYIYKEKTVYLVTAPCCDQFNMLYDEKCNPVCAPSGGYTGRGDGKCKDFDSTAKHVKMIWRNPSK